jgi:hypothetical protein
MNCLEGTAEREVRRRLDVVVCSKLKVSMCLFTRSSTRGPTIPQQTETHPRESTGNPRVKVRDTPSRLFSGISVPDAREEGEDTYYSDATGYTLAGVGDRDEILRLLLDDRSIDGEGGLTLNQNLARENDDREIHVHECRAQ